MAEWIVLTEAERRLLRCADRPVDPTGLSDPDPEVITAYYKAASALQGRVMTPGNLVRVGNETYLVGDVDELGGGCNEFSPRDIEAYRVAIPADLLSRSMVDGPAEAPSDRLTVEEVTRLRGLLAAMDARKEIERLRRDDRELRWAEDVGMGEQLLAVRRLEKEGRIAAADGDLRDAARRFNQSLLDATALGLAYTVTLTAEGLLVVGQRRTR